MTSSKLNKVQEILSNLVAEQQLLDQYLQSIPVRNWNTKTTYKNWDITAHVSYLAALEDLAHNALKKKGTDFNKYKGPKGLDKFEKEAIKKGTKVLWLQYGIHSDEAQALAEKENIQFVSNRCIKQEYQKLFQKSNPVFPVLKD